MGGWAGGRGPGSYGVERSRSPRVGPGQEVDTLGAILGRAVVLTVEFTRGVALVILGTCPGKRNKKSRPAKATAMSVQFCYESDGVISGHGAQPRAPGSPDPSHISREVSWGP